jgi:hypothetical protein
LKVPLKQRTQEKAQLYNNMCGSYQLAGFLGGFVGEHQETTELPENDVPHSGKTPCLVKRPLKL